MRRRRFRTCANTDRPGSDRYHRGDSNPNRDYRRSCGHSGARTHRHACSTCGTHRDAGAHLHASSHANGRTCRHAHCRARTRRHTRSYRNAGAQSDCNACAHRHARTDQYACTSRQPLTDADAYAGRHADPNPSTHRHT